MKKWRDRAFSLVEYLLALVFVTSSFSLIGEDAVAGNGFVTHIFGGKIALFIYMIWFAFLGLGLVYAKLRKRRRLHRNILMAIYLTTIYTSILTYYLYGFAAIIDDIIVGVLAAVCWLRWKFKIEYTTYEALGHGDWESNEED